MVFWLVLVNFTEKTGLWPKKNWVWSILAEKTGFGPKKLVFVNFAGKTGFWAEKLVLVNFDRQKTGFNPLLLKTLARGQKKLVLVDLDRKLVLVDFGPFLLRKLVFG